MPHPRKVGERQPVRTFVDGDVYDAWQLRFGGYASIAWVLETGMRAMLEGAAVDPNFEEIVKASMREYVHTAQSTKRKNVQPAPGA